MWKLSTYCIATESFADAADGRCKRIVLATRTGQQRLVDDRTWQLLAKGQFEGLPEFVRDDLVQAEVIVPAEENELVAILRQNAAAAAQTTRLYIVVQPTAACQLGCDYCGQRHTARKLSDADQVRLIEHVRDKLAGGQFKELEIGWFGGEPLLALPIMTSLTIRLRALTAEFGCRFRASVVSNGLALTPDAATHLVKDLAVDAIEITLDGPAALHDARRSWKKGAPSFERVFANVVALALRDDLRVNLTLRCNVDSRNRDGVTPLLQMLADAGIQKRIAGFYVAAVHGWGNEAGSRAMSAEEYAAAEIDWIIAMIKLGFQPRFLPRRKPWCCFAADPKAVLIDPYGQLFSCSEVSLVPSYESTVADRVALPVLGTSPPPSNVYALGDLASGEIAGRTRPLGDFIERIGRGDYACSTCSILPLCGGSCPKQWREGVAPCPSMKHNLQQRLLLSYAISRADDSEKHSF